MQDQEEFNFKLPLPLGEGRGEGKANKCSGLAFPHLTSPRGRGTTSLISYYKAYNYNLKFLIQYS